MSPVRRVFVVMANDYPESVWSTKVEAEAAIKRAKEGDAKMRRGLRPIHFTSYEFQLNKDPWP